MTVRAIPTLIAGLAVGARVAAAQTPAGHDAAVGPCRRDSRLTPAVWRRLHDLERRASAAADEGDTAAPELARRLERDSRSGRPACAHAWAVQLLATLALGNGDRDSAIVLFARAGDEAIASGSLALAAVAVGDRGVAHQMAGALAAAREDYGASMTLARRARADSTLRGALGNLGYVEAALGRPDLALLHLREAQRRDAAAHDAAASSDVENNLGTVFDDSARSTRRGALAAVLDSATVHYSASLALLPDTAAWLRATTLNNLGVIERRRFAVRRDTSALDSALALYRSAQRLRDGRPDTSIDARAARARTDHNVALVLADRGALDSAAAMLLRAAAAHAEARDGWWRALAFGELGRVYGRMPGRLADAALAFDSAAATIERLSAGAGDDGGRVTFGDQRAVLDVYASWTQLLRGAAAGGDSAARRASLVALERGRAQALLLLMRPAAGDSAAARHDDATRGVDAALVSGTTSLSYLATPDSLLVWLVTPDGRLVLGSSPVGIDSVARVVTSLREALGFRPRAATVARAYGATLVAARRGVRSGAENSRATATALSALASMVFPPAIATELRRGDGDLIVVPHASLSLVPFVALPIAGGRAPLIERYAVRYAPSLGVLDRVQRRPLVATPRVGGVRDALVIGDPRTAVVWVGGRPVRFDSLPAARREADSIAALLGATSRVGRGASLAYVRSRMPTAPIVHLATHGLAFDTYAMARETFVALAPSGSDDGRLTVGEILDTLPPLHAELVVLSACETGLGDMQEGEGMVGLQRALLARGARGVIATLWDVDDAATGAIMEGFYARWLGGGGSVSKAEALRQAQLEARRRFPRVSEWAAPQLIGAP